jgi:hypothetical protein
MRLSFASKAVVLSLCFLAVLFSPRYVFAQDAPPCAQVIELAETLYQQSRLDEVIALVADCLGDENVSTETAVRGYRLMALAYLRNDQVGDARLTIIELLGRNPSYLADPVQDLPAYVALVNNTREQLSLQTTGADDTGGLTPADSVVAGDVVPSQAAMDLGRRQYASYLRKGDMSLRGRIGWSSYGGERGRTGGGVFGEFVDNGGETAAVELTYSVTSLVGVGLQYQAARYPTILEAKTTTPTDDFPAIDKGTSSPWLHYMGIIVRGAVPTQAIVRPYGVIGFFTSFGLLNDKVSVSGGPKVAIGIDVTVGTGMGLFFEVEEQLLLPGDGADLTDRQYPFDLFSGAALGMRYTLAGRN